jgi:hypothetical protein
MNTSNLTATLINTVTSYDGTTCNKKVKTKTSEQERKKKRNKARNTR